jgi:hypothetical protein
LERTAPPSPGSVAHGTQGSLRSYTVGALPILNDLLARMRLEEFLQRYLPPEDPRCKLSAAKTLLVLPRNLLVSREPLYGLGEWAARYAPDFLGLEAKEVSWLNDDRAGRAADRLFLAEIPALVAVEQILQTCEAADCLRVAIVPCQEERFRQEKRGRPGPDTHYVKTTSSRFQLSCEIDGPKMAEESQTDGVFPLVSNVTELSELELLHAYKRQPAIEKRFSQLKTDFAVAPLYLKEVRRIQALLCLYFFALLVEALLERELRRAMQREQIEALPIYPEGRPCCWPTARRLLDLFEPVQRHTLSRKQQPDELIVRELTALQRRLLKLLGLSARGYGR